VRPVTKEGLGRCSTRVRRAFGEKKKEMPTGYEGRGGGGSTMRGKKKKEMAGQQRGNRGPWDFFTSRKKPAEGGIPGWGKGVPAHETFAGPFRIKKKKRGGGVCFYTGGGGNRYHKPPQKNYWNIKGEKSGMADHGGQLWDFSSESTSPPVDELDNH